MIPWVSSDIGQVVVTTCMLYLVWHHIHLED